MQSFVFEGAGQGFCARLPSRTVSGLLGLTRVLSAFTETRVRRTVVLPPNVRTTYRYPFDAKLESIAIP